MSSYGEVLDVVERAVWRNRWDEALLAALGAWRMRRLPRLADLVDALGAWRPSARPPATLYAWCDAAASYDPLTAEPLLATFGTTLPIGEHRREAARCAGIEQALGGFRTELVRPLYVARWPADPRASHALIDWYERLDVSWPHGAYGNPAPEDVAQQRAWYAAIYPGLANLADVRLRTRLEVLAQRPPGPQKWTRAVQVEAATAALAVLDETAFPPATEAELARFDALIDAHGGVRACAGPQRARPSFAPDELWRQIAASPDDDGPRLLLADVLLERGDPRGLAFAHQLGERRQGFDDVGRLWRRHWTTWLGDDLGRILLRKRCELLRGMLDTVTVGRDSPGYLFDAARDHRELLVVRRVYPNRIYPPHYARFVAALPGVRTVGIADRGFVDAFRAEAQPALAQVTTLHWLVGHWIGELAGLGSVAPAVTTIAAGFVPTEEVQATLHLAFPRLTSFRVQSAP